MIYIYSGHYRKLVRSERVRKRAGVYERERENLPAPNLCVKRSKSLVLR